MRREAVQSLGAEFLAGLNRTPRFDAGGALVETPRSNRGVSSGLRPVTVNFNVTAMDGADVDRWFRANQGRIVRSIRRAISDGAI